MSKLQRLRHWWRECFVENPLLARETGIGKGRAFWKSPMRWAVYLVLLYQAVEIGNLLHLWLLYLPVNHLDTTAWQALWDSRAHWLGTRLYYRSLPYLWLVVVIVPVWGSARAWWRERTLSSRDQLAASFVTVNQVVMAKALIWILPFALFGILALAKSMLLHPALWELTPAQASYHGGIGPSPFGSEFGDSPWARAYAMTNLAFVLITPLGIGAMATAVISWMVLRGWHPALCIVTICAVAVVWNRLVVIPFQSFFWQFLSETFGGEGGYRLHFLSVFGATVGNFIGLLIAVFLLRGLRRRVAEAYGMKR